MKGEADLCRLQQQQAEVNKLTATVAALTLAQEENGKVCIKSAVERCSFDDCFKIPQSVSMNILIGCSVPPAKPQHWMFMMHV